MRYKILYFFVVIFVAFSWACNGQMNEKQKLAVDTAISSLGKLAAAIDVGITYADYGSLLIDAKAQIDAANLILPEGNLKSELNASLDAFVDAREVWKAKRDRETLFPNYEPGKTLVSKYSLETKVDWQDDTVVDPDYAMQAIWKVAKDHYNKEIGRAHV